MKRPSLNDMQTAAEWLRCNEGDAGESEACSRVAKWLDEYGQQSEIRAAARQVGCTVASLKRVLGSQVNPRDVT